MGVHAYWMLTKTIFQKCDFRLLYPPGKQKQNYDHEAMKGSLLDNFSGKNIVLPMFRLDALVLLRAMKLSHGTVLFIAATKLIASVTANRKGLDMLTVKCTIGLDGLLRFFKHLSLTEA